MTREEAIRILKGDTLFNSREEQEAKEMAISSLEVDEAYQLEYEVSTQPSIEDFIEYAERKFGVKLYVKKSDDPDTVEKLFGEKAEEKYCDRNICAKNEYNGIGCEDCEVTKSQESTTKNDLGVDYISRADVNRLICEYRDDAAETGNERDLERAYGANAVGELINELPSVTPQEPFINKPCVSSEVCEHDKQKVLEKIRAEIETKYGQCKLTEYIVQYDGICTGINEIGDIADILRILDKYKAEIEPQESEDNNDKAN